MGIAISPKTLPIKLPSFPIDNMDASDDVCGVYFVLDKFSRVQYVGQSVNVKRRIKGHSHKWLFQQLGCVEVAYLECDRKSLLSLEAKYIARYRPAINVPPNINIRGVPRPVCLFLKYLFYSHGIHQSSANPNWLKSKESKAHPRISLEERAAMHDLLDAALDAWECDFD